MKTIAMQGIMGYGVVVSLHQLLGQSLMPTAYFRFEDQLYQHLCRFVLDKKSRGFTLAWPLGDKTNLVQSTIYRRSNITQEVWWPADHQGQKDVYYEKFGKRFFYHNGTLFMLDIHPRHRRSSVPKGQAELRVLALTDKPIKALLQEVWDSRRSREGDVQTKVFNAATTDYDGATWDVVARKPIREMDTVDINQEDQARLLEDAEKYLQESTKAWYARRGIPYRRGYLFHGPPGTGKPSLSVALAGRFKLDVYQVQLSSSGITDANILELFASLPSQCILLLEDIDSAGLTREVADADASKPKNHGGSLTLSGVLNALDGAAAPEGHILIMSTNHPENLDPALIRAGRIDYNFEFKLAEKEVAKKIFLRMMRDDNTHALDDVDADLLVKAEEFASRIPEGTLAPAKIQGYLLEHIGKTDIALAGVKEWAQNAVGEASKKKLEEAGKKDGEEKIKTLKPAGEPKQLKRKKPAGKPVTRNLRPRPK